MADLFLDPIKILCGCFFSDRNYIHMMKENLDALKTRLKELEDAHDDLERRVSIEEENKGWQRLARVRTWFERVLTVKSQVHDLLENSSTETKRLCLFEYCSVDCISSYQYGKDVLKRLEEVKELRDTVFDVVTQPVPKAEKKHIPTTVTVGLDGKVNEAWDRSVIPARRMEITHSENPKHWTWSSIYEPPNEEPIEIATMKEVYWMELSGNFSTKNLIPDTKYEVVFVVKLDQFADGFEEPVNLTVRLKMRDKSDQIPQEKILRLDDVCGDDEWVDVKAGDFVAPPKDAPPAKIYFKMYQYNTEIRKKGLVVKCVKIRAVK